MQQNTSALLKSGLIALSLLLINVHTSFAQTSNPTGLWQTIDDKSGKPRSLVRVEEHNGELSATIEKGLLATDEPDAICDKCEDDRKDQPIIGMSIIRGLTKNGDQYDGGTILDPENGKIYKCKIKLDESGRKLDVRGYIGISLIGRTQTWTRVE